MTHTNHTPDAVPPAQGADEPGTENCRECGYALVRALDGTRYCQVAKCSLAGTPVTARCPSVSEGGYECELVPGHAADLVWSDPAPARSSYHVIIWRRRLETSCGT